MALFINFLVTFSHIFQNVVKLATGQKFDLSFLLEAPLSNVETMTILESSIKMPFDKLLFITYDNG